METEWTTKKDKPPETKDETTTNANLTSTEDIERETEDVLNSLSQRELATLDEFIKDDSDTEDEDDIDVNIFMARTSSTLYDDEDEDNDTFIIWGRDEIPGLAARPQGQAEQ